MAVKRRSLWVFVEEALVSCFLHDTVDIVFDMYRRHRSTCDVLSKETAILQFSVQFALRCGKVPKVALFRVFSAFMNRCRGLIIARDGTLHGVKY